MDESLSGMVSKHVWVDYLKLEGFFFFFFKANPKGLSVVQRKTATFRTSRGLSLQYVNPMG